MGTLMNAITEAPRPTFAELFTPKLVTVLREGYEWQHLRADALAGLTVAIVAIEGLMSGNGTQLIELSVQEASNFHKQSLRYAKAVAASSGRLMELAGTCLGYGNGKLPPVPDLRPLGIRQCRSCGCTGAHACEGGCYWVETDLRSACVPGAAPS